MAKTIGGVDVAEFKKQKAAIQQAATSFVAEKIQEIKKLFEDIKDIAEASEIVVDVRELKYTVEAIEEMHPDWNSSSYHC